LHHRYRQHNAEEQTALRASIAAKPSNGLMLDAFAGKPASTHSFAPTPKRQMPVLPTKTQRFAKVMIGEPWGIEVEIDPVRGAVVTKVDPGSVAARVKIPVGAAFIAINGKATPTMTKQEALTMIRQHSALDLTVQVPPDTVGPAWPSASPPPSADILLAIFGIRDTKPQMSSGIAWSGELFRCWG